MAGVFVWAVVGGKQEDQSQSDRMEGNMPIESIVMAIVLSGWVVAFVVALIIVAYAGFFGVAVLGVIVLCLAVIIDQERDGAVGAAVTPGFLAQQFRARTEISHAERSALRDAAAEEARLTRLFKYLGATMIAVGLTGFWLFQL
jgi:hypothetical protein